MHIIRIIILNCKLTRERLTECTALEIIKNKNLNEYNVSGNSSSAGDMIGGRS